MDSMTRHFGLKKAVSGFLLIFNSHPWLNYKQGLKVTKASYGLWSHVSSLSQYTLHAKKVQTLDKNK